MFPHRGLNAASRHRADSSPVSNNERIDVVLDSPSRTEQQPEADGSHEAATYKSDVLEKYQQLSQMTSLKQQISVQASEMDVLKVSSLTPSTLLSLSSRCACCYDEIKGTQDLKIYLMLIL